MLDTQPATITAVTVEEVGQDDIPSPIVHFKEYKQGLILNKTNAAKLKAMLGAETDQWAGKQIELYRTMTTYMGEEVDCLRIRDITGVPTPADFNDKLPEYVPGEKA